MAVPTTRKTFKDYCLRRLGAPVIDIDVDDDQVEDRIDEALTKFGIFHYDGVEKLYMKHLVTAEDAARKYIELPDLIIGVTNVFPITTYLSSSSLFNVNYQFALNDLFNIQSTSMVPYYMSMQHISLINDFFATQPAIRFNYHTGKLYIEDWINVKTDKYIVIDCHRILDPKTNAKIWSDLWLQQYATALIKRQWDAQLSKFTITLPGGATWNGQQIEASAQQEIEKLEEELVDTWSIPGTLFIG